MKTLTGTEMIIMKAIWEHDAPIKTMELIECLKNEYGRDYARTTVTTFLERLKGKDYIETSKTGRISYIHPLITKEEYLTDYLKKMVDFWFEGDYELALKLCQN